MKLNCCLMLGVLVAVSATAQSPTNSLPVIPPPATAAPLVAPAPAPVLAVPAEVKATNAAAKKATVKKKKKAVVKPKATTVKKAADKAKPADKSTKPATDKTALTEATATLGAGPAEVAVSHVNIRGQAGLKGEVIAHLQKGDAVNVLSQITLDKHKADEPAQWAKISLPTNVAVWVSSKYVDVTNKTVLPKKLNMRGGPGDNYSVLGMVEKGTALNITGTKGEWTKIDAPASSYAFVAAMYLKQEATGNVPNNPQPSTETLPPVATTVADNNLVIAPPAAPVVAENPAPAAPPAVITPVVASAPATPEVPAVGTVTNAEDAETNLPPRIVTHEGSVRPSVSIVAPTYFELYDPANNKAVNYLYSSTTNLNLARYNGMKVSVTGEEGLDVRWQQTPVLTIQKIYVVSTNGMIQLPDPMPAPEPAKTDTKKPWYHFGLW